MTTNSDLLRRRVLADLQRHELVANLVRRARDAHRQPGDTPEQTDARVAEALGWIAPTRFLRRRSWRNGRPDAQRVQALFGGMEDATLRTIMQLAAAAGGVLDITFMAADDADVDRRIRAITHGTNPQ